MVIVFYDCANKSILIASEQYPLKSYPVDTPNIAQHIPNDDILYIQSGAYYTKQQFINVLYDKVDEADREHEAMQPRRYQQQYPQQPNPQERYAVSDEPIRHYVHATKHGTVVINDIMQRSGADRALGGLRLEGRWHFVPLDSIDQEEIKKSHEFQSLLKMKRIEIVDSNYIREHQGEISQFNAQTAAERALDSILVPADIKADDVVRRLRQGENVRPTSGAFAIPIQIRA